MNSEIPRFFTVVLPLGEPRLLGLQLLLLPEEAAGKPAAAGSRAEVWAEQVGYSFDFLCAQEE